MSHDDRAFLRRGLIAFFLFTASEWAAWVAVLVHAFSVGGAVTATVATLAQLAAAALAAPIGAAWLARHRHEHALRRTFLLQALAFAAIAVALWFELELAVVILLASIATAAITFTRPVYFSMLARLVRDALQLARVNGVSTVVEGLAILIGPALAGGLLAASATHVVLLLCAVTLLLAMYIVRQGRWPLQWHRETSTQTDRADWRAGLRAGFRNLGRARDIRTVLAGVAGGFFLVGSIDVFAVVFASEALRLGPSAPGTMISALGTGSVLGAGVLALVTHDRSVGAPLLIATLLASIPFAMTSVSPGLQTASLWLVAAGIGKGMLDVIGRTALQQRLGRHELAAAFGCQECLAHLALGFGALFALPLVTTFGARGAFVAAAAVLPMLCVMAMMSGRMRSSADA